MTRIDATENDKQNRYLDNNAYLGSLGIGRILITLEQYKKIMHRLSITEPREKNLTC